MGILGGDRRMEPADECEQGRSPPPGPRSRATLGRPHRRPSKVYGFRAVVAKSGYQHSPEPRFVGRSSLVRRFVQKGRRATPWGIILFSNFAVSAGGLGGRSWAGRVLFLQGGASVGSLPRDAAPRFSRLPS